MTVQNSVWLSSSLSHEKQRQLFLCCISSVINNRKQEQRKNVFHQQGNVKRTINIKEKRKYSICDFFY